jgi:hypothetical protein
MLEIKLDEVALVAQAHNHILTQYRQQIETLGREYFSETGLGRKKVQEAFEMKMSSDRTRQAIDFAIDKTIGSSLERAVTDIAKEYDTKDTELHKEVHSAIFANQQHQIKKYCEIYFNEGSDGSQRVKNSIEMRVSSERHMETVNRVVDIQLESLTNQAIVKQTQDSRALIAETLAEPVRDSIVSKLEAKDISTLVDNSLANVIDAILLQIGTEAAKASVGEVVYEAVMQRMPHAAIPHVGRVVDQLPFEAILRWYLKTNAVKLCISTIERLTGALMEKRYTKILEQVTDSESENPMPFPVIDIEENAVMVPDYSHEKSPEQPG